MQSKLLAFGVAGASLGAVLWAAQSPGQAVQPGGSAAPSAGPRVAVLDLVRIFQDAAQIKDLNEEIRRKQDEYAAEVKQRQEKLQGLELETTAFRPGTKEYETRRNEATRMRIDSGVWAQVKQEDIERDKFEWTRVIYEKTLAVCEAVAKERGFDVVLQRMDVEIDTGAEQPLDNLRRMIQRRTVVYHVPQVDITEVVLRQLDADYKAAGGKSQLNPAPANPPPMAPGTP